MGRWRDSPTLNKAYTASSRHIAYCLSSNRPGVLPVPVPRVPNGSRFEFVNLARLRTCTLPLLLDLACRGIPHPVAHPARGKRAVGCPFGSGARRRQHSSKVGSRPCLSRRAAGGRGTSRRTPAAAWNWLCLSSDDANDEWPGAPAAGAHGECPTSPAGRAEAAAQGLLPAGERSEFDRIPTPICQPRVCIRRASVSA